MARDSQRQRVYRAETHVPRGAEYFSISEVRAAAAEIIQSEWWVMNARSQAPVTIIEKTMSYGKAWYHTNLITLPRVAWYERYLIHELAHLAHGVPHWHEAGHGARYVQTYHAMIERFMGHDAARHFRLGCLRQGIAAGLPVEMEETIGANQWYERSYRRYKWGIRSSPPALRKGMTPRQARAIRERVDRELVG